MRRVIELCGLPGSGKSTLCRSVVAELERVGVHVEDASLPAGPGTRVRRLRAKIAGFAVEAVLHPRKVLGTARSGWSCGLRGRELVARVVNLVVLDRRMCRSAGPVVMLDQGLVQELMSVDVTGDALRMAPRLPVRLAGGDHVVVVLDVPEPVVDARLTGRRTGESRLERLAPADRRAALERAVASRAAVTSWADQRGAEIWRVGGTTAADVSEVVARIRRSAHG